MESRRDVATTKGMSKVNRLKREIETMWQELEKSYNLPAVVQLENELKEQLTIVENFEDDLYAAQRIEEQ